MDLFLVFIIDCGKPVFLKDIHVRQTDPFHDPRGGSVFKMLFIFLKNPFSMYVRS